MIFADRGLVVDPNAEELAGIAVVSAASYEALFNKPEKFAMLFFSTHGSAQHERVDKAQVALELVKTKTITLNRRWRIATRCGIRSGNQRGKAHRFTIGGQRECVYLPQSGSR
jgi:phosphate acetyltransferase